MFFLLLLLCLQLCDRIPEAVQPHPAVRRLVRPALRVPGLLRHRVPGRLQLLGEPVLLLGVFRRLQQFVGGHTDAHRHEELEEDLGSVSGRQGQDQMTMMILHCSCEPSVSPPRPGGSFFGRHKNAMHAVQERANHHDRVVCEKQTCTFL